MRYLLLSITLLISTITSSQTMMTNKKPIDADRYGDIKGTPYYYDNPVKAVLHLKGVDEPYNVDLNINLQEDLVEVYDGTDYTEIDWKQITYITIEDSTNVSKINDDLIFVLYHSDNYKLINKPKISIEKKEHRPPGSIIIKESFNKKDYYTLMDGRTPHELSVNKKSIKKVLGSQAIDIAKKNKIKLKSEEDLVALLTLLEQE